MSCYVDTVRSYPGAGLQFTEFCHLLADEPAELHEMAQRLGMPRRSFQEHPWRWHYDLPEHLRADAVRLGAQEVDLAAVGRLLRARRLALSHAAGTADPGGGIRVTNAPVPASTPLLAEDLLRVMLAQGGGSLPQHGLRERSGAARRLDVALRAALFCDLARSGHLTGVHGPAPTVSAAGNRYGAAHPEPPGGAPPDRILAAVLAAVQRRPALAWRRWFRHIRDDRGALVDRLVRSGRWHPQGGSHFADADPDGAQRLQARAFTVSELIEAPSGERETILAFLYALTGPRMPAERVLGWDVRLAILDATPAGPTLRQVLDAARWASRPRHFRPG